MSYIQAVKAIQRRIDNKVTSLNINLPRLNEYLGGIGEEEAYLIFGATGTTKTGLAVKLTIIDLVDHILAHPKDDFRTYYFSLELSAEILYYKIFAHLLHRKTGKQYSVDYFRNKKQQLTQAALEELALIKPWLDVLDQKVVIQDQYRTPGSIFKYLEGQLLKIGSKKVVDGATLYVKNNPNLKIVVVVDTINALQKEKDDPSEYESIKRWSEHYTKQTLKMVYKCAIFNIQQTDKQSTTSQYTNSGKKVDDKFIPRIEHLAKVKTTPDDVSCAISIYNPSRYEVADYDGYDIAAMGNNFRYLRVVKSSYGEEGVGVGVYIDNAHLDVEELPRPSDPVALTQFYLDHDLITTQSKKPVSFIPNAKSVSKAAA